MKLMPALFALLSFSAPLAAQSYVWKLHDEVGSSLTRSEQQAWLKTFWKAGPPIQPDQADLQKHIEEAETAYLKMEMDVLSGMLVEIQKQLHERPLSKDSFRNFQKFYELKALKEYSFDGGLQASTAEEIQFFLQDDSFIKRMPKAIQNAQKPSLPLKAFSTSEEIWIYGQKAKPSQLPPGKYIVYIWRAPVMETAVLSHSAESSELQSLQKFDAFSQLSLKELQERLRQSRPPSTLAFNIQIFRKTSNKEELVTNFASQVKPTATPNNTSQPKSFPFEEINTDEWDETPPTTERRSLFRSPWFWLAVGAAAIGGGVFVYHATNGPSEVHTP